MKYALTLTLAALFAPGCAALGLPSSTLDQAAAAQNLEAVKQIVAENEAYLAADPKDDALKAPQRDRNAAAVDLATKLAGK